MLLVRRRAPNGSYFTDGDRASGVFGVLATGFSILLGLVVVLAFTSYDESRAGAEDEATTVSQQIETAQLLPKEVRAALTGQLVCYARAVVHQEWPLMDDGELGDAMNPWGKEMFRTLRTIDPETPDRPGGLQQVARPDRRPRVRPQRPHPRRRGRDPGAPVARAVRHGGRHLLVHALLRRQRRGQARAGHAHGGRHDRDHLARCC